MKLLLDMGLAQSTAIFLRTASYDAVHLREEGLQRLPDEQIMAKALREGRVILTHDLDFGRLVALSRRRLPSVVTFRLSHMRPRQVNQYLQDILTRFDHELEAGVLISVTDDAIRVRHLPVK